MTTDGELSDAEFDQLRQLVYARTGMIFEQNKRSYLEKRVAERLRSRTDCSMQRYLIELRCDGSGTELQQLINLLTVNETYFFREDYQLKALTSSIIPELVAAGRRSFRIWSLPCATGEEAYSIAIHLLEQLPGVDDYEFEIVGSDIDTRVLQNAIQGIYQARSLQYVPPSLRQKYFNALDEDRWQICAELRGSVSFTRANVVDAMQIMKHGTFEIVFCRNLLIYFDDISRRLAAENIYEALAPGGFVCLGHSESMSRISAMFRVRRFEEGIVYQRP